MAHPTTEQQILGTLIRQPKLLLQTDKFQLLPEDFDNQFYKYLFWAIDHLSDGATGELQLYELEHFLLKNPTSKKIFEDKNGRQLLIDCQDVPVSNFEIIYDTLKKENLMRDMKKRGDNIDRYYVEIPITKEQQEISRRFSEHDIQTLINEIDKDFIQLKTPYLKGDSSESRSIYDGMEDLLEELEQYPEIGLPLQGKYFNHIVSGAITSRLYIRSASSGTGKTRGLVGDACQLALPVTYNWDTRQWEITGYNEKVLVMITEQSFDEVQKMALAYMTGINESVIKKNLTNAEQKKVISQALKLFQHFKENFKIVRIPNPSISLVKQIMKEQIALHNIKYIFYDYIFISPSLLGEFRGMNLRNDKNLSYI